MKVMFCAQIYILNEETANTRVVQSDLNVNTEKSLEASIVLDTPDGYPSVGDLFEFYNPQGELIFEAFEIDQIRNQVGNPEYDCYILLKHDYVSPENGQYLLEEFKASGWNCSMKDYSARQ